MKAITASLIFILSVALTATAIAQPAPESSSPEGGAAPAAGTEPGTGSPASPSTTPSPTPPPPTGGPPPPTSRAKAPGAKEEAKVEEEKGFFGTLGDVFSDGGPMMVVILLVSLVGLALFLERAYGLYLQSRLDSTAFLDKILHHIERREYRRALDSCNLPTRHPLTTVVRAGVLRANRREKEIERAMEKEMLAALPDLQKRVGLMSLLANSATLLGLLGTIFGLIKAFNAVGVATAAERQSALADGISQAMYTTAFGITVAVPLLFFHHFLSKRAERMTMEIEEGASSMLVALAGERREKAGSDRRGGYHDDDDMGGGRTARRRR